MPRERFSSEKALAARLKVTTRTIRNWRTAGLLPAYRLGGTIRYAESDVQAFLASGREEAPKMPEPAARRARRREDEADVGSRVVSGY